MEEACGEHGTLAEDGEASTWAPSHTVNLTTAWAEEGAVSQAAPVPRVRRIVGELSPSQAGDIGDVPSVCT